MAGLTRGAIVEAAFELLAEGGTAAITARALAGRLGVRPGALYYHVPDMAALSDEMATVIMRELMLPGADAAHPNAEWRPFLRDSAQHIRRVLLRYREGAKLFSGTYLTDDDALGSMEAPLRVLTEAGFGLVDALRSFQTLYAFVIGHVIEEQHRAATPERYSAALRHQRIDAERFPLTDAANEAFLGDADEAFDWGVDIILAGIAIRNP
ncbi:TetR/AcrR family transcriptional regulator C-terminal domain-containing protein [Herbiconiux sp.]|uniref:TetR/AcrR family transcriptional regulator C-terminal domain-containing protein n=1 Tax=Herbiconiux sp. TaxID=1871186 RepID=UPI0025C37AEE|nr:TetR/AcrR family transcriptional regulator C-terminal domain-containing protein [Herbiconiux sp.]